MNKFEEKIKKLVGEKCKGLVGKPLETCKEKVLDIFKKKREKLTIAEKIKREPVSFIGIITGVTLFSITFLINMLRPATPIATLSAQAGLLAIASSTTYSLLLITFASIFFISLVMFFRTELEI